MSGKVNLTRVERMVAERLLRAAGYVQRGDVWKLAGLPAHREVDLREVFPTPFTAIEQAGVARCVCPQPAGDDPACPVHGGAS